jgi:hypothetical protein
MVAYRTRYLGPCAKLIMSIPKKQSCYCSGLVPNTILRISPYLIIGNDKAAAAQISVDTIPRMV